MNPDPAQLHKLARERWLASETEDPLAERYSAAMESILTGSGHGAARPLTWARCLLRYEMFTAARGSAPRDGIRAETSVDGVERRLGGWARYQRRSADRINAYQRARLDVSPAFAWDERASAWQRSLRACLEHRMRTGELPHLNGMDPIEFALARWLGRQLRALQQGQLEEFRAQQLNDLLGR